MGQTSYDDIALEYYSDQHQTSRNFDETTRHAFSSNSLGNFGDKVLELGAGRGRVGEYLGIEPSKVVQLDNSEAMLSLPDREACSLKVLANAQSIPLAEKQFSAVVGFLADPFLGLRSLSEALRVLTPKGRLLITTPTQEWGSALRLQIGLDLMNTRFRVYSKDVEVQLPSYLYPSSQLAEMLTHVGFEDITISDHALPTSSDPISPDISIVSEKLGKSVHELPILHCIQAIRP